MANIASVAYAIEGPQEVLKKINEAIVVAIHTDDNRYEMYKAAENLSLPIEEASRLGGEIEEEPTWSNGALRINSEERWGLQDFAELLEKQFPDIKVYWIVEEPGCEVFCTNDAEGKYFPERYWVDTCIDDIYNSKYFQTEQQVYEWLDKLTYGKVKSEEDVEKFNSEDSDAADENWIYVHEFDIDI